MGNPIPREMQIGTIGELLVQLRLLQYGVQAAPPIKDSGNDLIAIKGEVAKFIQVKTSISGRWNLRTPKIYHLVAVVKLVTNGDKILLDQSEIYLLRKGERLNDKKLMTQDMVNEIWRS